MPSKPTIKISVESSDLDALIEKLHSANRIAVALLQHVTQAQERSAALTAQASDLVSCARCYRQSPRTNADLNWCALGSNYYCPQCWSQQERKGL